MLLCSIYICAEYRRPTDQNRDGGAKMFISAKFDSWSGDGGGGGNVIVPLPSGSTMLKSLPLSPLET